MATPAAMKYWSGGSAFSLGADGSAVFANDKTSLNGAGQCGAMSTVNSLMAYLPLGMKIGKLR